MMMKIVDVYDIKEETCIVELHRDFSFTNNSNMVGWDYFFGQTVGAKDNTKQ